MVRTVVVFLLLLLAACAPSAENARPGVVLINGPTEHQVLALADEFQPLLEGDRAHGYRFVFPASARFQETHRDMFGTRAPRQASLIARNLGARYAIMVGAPVYTRDVRVVQSPLGDSRLVTSAVTVEVSIIDPEGAETVYREHAGGVASRLETTRQPLVSERDDPDLRRLRQAALAELAPGTAAELNRLLASSAP